MTEKQNYLLLGNEYFDVIIGEEEPATSKLPTQFNLVGRQGLLGEKHILDNLPDTIKEKRIHRKTGKTWILIRMDINKHPDFAHLPKETLTKYAALQEENRRLQMQVADLMSKTMTLANKELSKEWEIKEAKHRSDVQKASLQWKRDYEEQISSYYGFPQTRK